MWFTSQLPELFDVIAGRKQLVPFRMAIENV